MKKQNEINPQTASEKKPLSTQKAKRIVIFGALSAVLLITLACILFSQTDAHSVTTYAMETYVQQTVYGNNQEEAAQTAANRIVILEELISHRNPDSDISALNAGAGGNFLEVDTATWQILQLCKDVYTQSKGAFDSTVYPLSHLWAFDKGKEYVPSQKQIDLARADVDGSQLLLQEDNTAVLKSKGMALDLDGISQGAACDTAVQTYKEFQVGSGIVAVGSSIGVYGNKFGSNAWEIAVYDDNTQEAVGTLRLTQGFLSTASAYENSFSREGVFFHALLSPLTGYPADSGLRAVIVKADSGALSDALSAACFVLGAEKSKLILEYYGAEAVFITQEQQLIATGNMQESFRLTRDGYVWNK